MFAIEGQPNIDSRDRAALVRDYERFGGGLPEKLEHYVYQQYQLDLSSEYGGHFIKNPFGKASGQLSLNLSQVRRDCEEQQGGMTWQILISGPLHG